MKHIYTIIFMLFLHIGLYAEGGGTERVYIHLDKDCYVAGEDMLVKFYVVDCSFQPSDLSRVGYVEICDTEKPHIQYKIAIEEGRGTGKIKIPLTTPSGIYRLTAYTRYMRNEGENVFFKREVAIVNMNQDVESERIELTHPSEQLYITDKKSGNIDVVTDKGKYNRRDQVALSIRNLPSDVSDLVISVVCNDSITFISQVDHEKWKKMVSVPVAQLSSLEWVPEYEGHIITGEIIPALEKNVNQEELMRYSSSIAFTGKEIRCLFGKINGENSTVSYFTEEIYGTQDVVSTLLLDQQAAEGYRVDILSPFAEVLPAELPAMKIVPDNKSLMDRSVGIQLNQVMLIDSLGEQTPVGKLYNYEPIASYDFDEYTRFNTVRQTIIEYVTPVAVRKINQEYHLKVFIREEGQYNKGNTLVLLDGIPLYDHSYILNYNPHLIKKMDIYNGKYSFGGAFYDCMVLFTTYRGDLPSIQLGNESQLFVYDCPGLPVTFDSMPDYSDTEVKKSLKPDFRHTLYWEPMGEYAIDESTPVIFYTSDLTGEFKVIVEGITQRGNMIYGSTEFRVDK